MPPSGEVDGDGGKAGALPGARSGATATIVLEGHDCGLHRDRRHWRHDYGLGGAPWRGMRRRRRRRRRFINPSPGPAWCARGVRTPWASRKTAGWEPGESGRGGGRGRGREASLLARPCSRVGVSSAPGKLDVCAIRSRELEDVCFTCYCVAFFTPISQEKCFHLSNLADGCPLRGCSRTFRRGKHGHCDGG